jgi:hypothetical protein
MKPTVTVCPWPSSPALGQPMLWMDGAQGRNRTTDTAIFSRMLYQLSYLGIRAASKPGGRP